MTTWMTGEVVYLVPGLPTAPRVAYQQPQVRIVTVDSWRVEVELDGGTRLWTSVRNIARRPWNPDPPQPKMLRPKALLLADGERETTLW